MAEPTVCPDCGALLPAGAELGRCPGCLLKIAAGSSLDKTSPVPAQLLRGFSAAPGPGRLGDYELLEGIGSGGMGMVWKARQISLNRLVAFKVIKPGMDSTQVLARFDAERHALALMDHSNIARVIDAGTTPAGLPYFVMELVEGVPILEFCDQWRLSIPKRLELFMQVCLAIQHAHQKGIIHRDIKPGNVLVAAHAGGGVPKVIDFGIAKAIGPRLTPASFATEVGAIIGTLEYMSPEQASLNAADIDTRSDIYSLGILLYELMTGTTPLHRPSLWNYAFDEILRRIREEEPPKPSTRLLQLQSALSVTAGHRGVASTQLARTLRGDLDWIAMKALEKDRNRRYETANDLALDIQRYLQHDPVLAGPPTTRYRVGKFVRKHRAAVAWAAVFVVSLLTASVVSLVMASRARTAQANAQANAENALREEVMRRTISRFYVENVIRPVRPDGGGVTAEERGQLGPTITLREALERAEGKIERAFFGLPAAEAEVRSELGVAFQGLGDYTNAVRQHERVLELRRRDEGTNLPAYQAALNNLGTAYGEVGRLDEGVRVLEESYAVARRRAGTNVFAVLLEMNNLALAYKDVGRLDEAHPMLAAILHLRRERLGPDAPDSLLSLENLALTSESMGRTNEALELFQEHLSRCQNSRYFGPNHPTTFMSMCHLASRYSESGEPAKAIPLFECAREGLRKTLTDRHPDTLACLQGLGAAHFRLRQFGPAVERFSEAYRLKKAALGESASSTLLSLDSLCGAYMGARDYSNAVWHLELAITYKRTHGAPDLAEFQKYLDRCRGRLGSGVR